MPLLVTEELIGLLVVYPPRTRTLAPRRDGAAGGARRPARGRGPERDPPRAGNEAQGREGARSRRRAADRPRAAGRCTRSRARSRRAVARCHGGRGRASGGRAARRRRGRAPDSGRARRRAGRHARPRPGGAARTAPCGVDSRAAAAAGEAAGPPAVPSRASRWSSTRTRRANLGASYELLVPFLERGATCVVVPVRTPTELLATLTLLSLDPQNPITDRGARAGRLDRAARRRSRSTTRASTSSRRRSRTRCSARCCRARSPSCRASRSAPSTPPPRGSRSAATSTTSSRSPTDGSRSCSAT